MMLLASLERREKGKFHSPFYKGLRDLESAAQSYSTTSHSLDNFQQKLHCAKFSGAQLERKHIDTALKTVQLKHESEFVL